MTNTVIELYIMMGWPVLHVVHASEFAFIALCFKCPCIISDLLLKCQGSFHASVRLQLSTSRNSSCSAGLACYLTAPFPQSFRLIQLGCSLQ